MSFALHCHEFNGGKDFFVCIFNFQTKLKIPNRFAKGKERLEVQQGLVNELRNVAKITSPTMHHIFGPFLPDLKLQKYQNSLLFLQLLQFKIEQT